MRNERVRKVSVSLVVAIAFLTDLPLMTAAGHAEEIEATFKTQCGECHGPRDIHYWGRQRADAAVRQTWLEQFLRKHHPPSETEPGLIITYIQSMIARGATPN